MKEIANLRFRYLFKTNIQLAQLNGMSDHRPVYLDIKMNVSEVKQIRTIKKRCFKNFNELQFCSDLASKPWEVLTQSDNVGTVATVLEKFLTEALDVHAPLTEFTIKPNYNQHLKPNTKQLMMKRDLLRKQLAKAHGLDRSLLQKQYKVIRNKTARQVKRDTRSGTQQKIMSASNSTSALWRIANSKKHSSTIVLEEDGKEIKEEEEVASVINNHFVNKIANLRNRVNADIAEDPLLKLRSKTKSSDFKHFTLQNVTEADVIRAFKKAKAKSSTGYDGFSMKVLKSCKNVLATPLAYLINQSIAEGTFPDQWKLAVVSPLLKKGSSKDKANYRPVALLSSVSKIVEAVIHEQIAKHVERQGLLPKSQHGFRKHRSTTSALSYICSKWEKWRSEGKYVGALVFDLSAAFDCLDAEILDKKLHWVGFGKLTRQWIKSYLYARRQKVKIGDATSDEKELLVGSPEGAILSPLLFLLYVMDLELWTEIGTTGYADDTGVYHAAGELDEVKRVLEVEARNILTFMASNSLITNESKTELLIIAPKKRPTSTPVEIKVGDATIKESNSIRLLGLSIDNDLQWTTHTTKVKSIISSRIGLIRRLKRKLSPAQLRQLSHALIYSQIRYALSIYGRPKLQHDDPAHKLSGQIQVELNHLMRTIAGKRREEHHSVEELTKLTGLPTLNQLIVESTLIETWKSIHRNLPSSEFFVAPTKRDIPSRRPNNALLIPPSSRADWFPSKGAKLWNLLPKSTQEETNFIAAKKEIKNFSKIYSIV